MFFLLYKRTDDGVFDDFPKISENFPKLFRRPNERFRTFSENFRKFPKVSEDFRRLLKTFEEDPKMFRWYNNEFKYNLRDKLDVNEIIDIFTCEDIVSFLSISYHSVYHWLYIIIFICRWTEMFYGTRGDSSERGSPGTQDSVNSTPTASVDFPEVKKKVGDIINW